MTKVIVEEFEAFMRAYQNMVYSTALRLVGNEADALDMAQDAFLKAHERFDQLRQNPAAGGWLKTVTTNLCLNHLSRCRGVDQIRFSWVWLVFGCGCWQPCWMRCWSARSFPSRDCSLPRFLLGRLESRKAVLAR